MDGFSFEGPSESEIFKKQQKPQEIQTLFINHGYILGKGSEGSVQQMRRCRRRRCASSTLYETEEDKFQSHPQQRGWTETEG